VKAGVDVLLEDPRGFLRGDAIGLVTNPTGVTCRLESTLDAFHSHPDVTLKAVFGPEHGARGDAQDALPVEGYVDEATGLPINSLYGEHLVPTPEMLDGLDALVFDTQDCGARFYTYVSTMTYCMEAAARDGLDFVVLDRPDPINGVDVEGGVLEPGFESFIGLHPVPFRHGLTVGELASLINEKIKCNLEVVRLEGWSRCMWYDETGLPWVQPSPNMPTLETATVFPGTCLFEGVNVVEGRGTTRPFEYLGAPWVDGRRWANAMNAFGLPGARFRSCHFTPAFWRHSGEMCSGLQVHVEDRDSYRPVETGIHLLHALIKLQDDRFRFNEPTYDERRHFDLLAGTDRLRLSLMEGEPVEEIVGAWEPEVERFMKRRERHLLYGE
jgi:uncharacterized protein YbbC (DUF1343 family)